MGRLFFPRRPLRPINRILRYRLVIRHAVCTSLDREPSLMHPQVSPGFGNCNAAVPVLPPVATPKPGDPSPDCSPGGTSDHCGAGCQPPSALVLQDRAACPPTAAVVRTATRARGPSSGVLLLVQRLLRQDDRPLRRRLPVELWNLQQRLRQHLDRRGREAVCWVEFRELLFERGLLRKQCCPLRMSGQLLSVHVLFAVVNYAQSEKILSQCFTCLE
ncbi:hypothetical protein CDEST_10862 [Colletotrichum destructivum]|uniref:Uncharacterized protein n=1 Tax=Colletotrichum destructivum TaxID=34406 RepID=A0AAX4IRQ5_9PEZI|nr:hypothetical protein CDEST_10862 [Colletotrichum destructivum]